MARGHALIVEDSSTARIILARLLERADISSKGVATAEEAFPALQAEAFDLIFLDHILPGMNGFQALEKLKQQPTTRDIPVFMYTSQNAEKYIQEARELGAAGVIRKQVDRDQLLRTLDIILSDVPEPEQSEALRVAVEDGGYPIPESAEQNARRLTGRMSTLEVAYEELEQELRELRNTLEQADNGYEHSKRQTKIRMRLLAGANLIFAIALIWLVTWQDGRLDTHIERTNEQFSLMRSVVGGVIELISR
ncbi:response regulator [Marinobacter sp.]|uniref:response regulator n=1 Tax=Marinobacter sp. TaxID=50741 RepID=UPI003568990F